MKQRFMDRDFLLSTQTARCLYHDHAASMPIVDFHCHVSPKEIYEDRRFADLWEIWLEGDHYKWRLMRGNGVDERLITGDASHWEKFMAFAQTLPRAIGNPLYHWCHLELRRYFGYEGVLNAATAKEVWEHCNTILQESDMGARGIIRKSNVAFIGTTDDPADSLEWHEKIAADPTSSVTVSPSFRPDKALNIQKGGFADYIEQLARSVNREQLNSLEDVKAALTQRLAFFVERGCRASDHGLDYVPFRPISKEEADAVLRKALRGEALTAEEVEGWQTALLRHCAQEYRRRNVVMQLHFNCVRNPNSRMFQLLGPDTGFDCMGEPGGANALFRLLDTLDAAGALPRTILYSLNPADDTLLDTMIGAFQGSEVPGKIQHGAAWWFNDHRLGMERQLTSLAALGVLGNFVGMLTDSRSFLSYTRHEYFRRILCNLLGDWVESGAYPDDLETLGGLVRDICYHNGVRYFELEETLCK